VTRFLDYSRNSQKNLIEQRTIDDFKTTPVMIAALGGHMDIIEELVRNGADLTVKLENTRHGIAEIAAIRQDHALLAYLHEHARQPVPDVPGRLRALMTSERNVDEGARASLGRTLEHYSVHFSTAKAVVAAASATTTTTTADDDNEEQRQYNHNSQQLSIDESIAYELVSHADFGASLAGFIRLCVDNESALASSVIILSHTLDDERVRRGFLNAGGIKNIIFFVDKNRQALQSRIDRILAKLKSSKTVDEFEVEDLFDRTDEDKDLDDSQVTYVECASVGQALSHLTRHAECLAQMNADGSNDKVLALIKLLFDARNLFNVFTLDKMFKEKGSANAVDSIQMKIFNIINMGKKNQARKLTPSEVFSRFESTDDAAKKPVKKDEIDEFESEDEETKAERVANEAEAERKARQVGFSFNFG
jgi:hypothetical protein